MTLYQQWVDGGGTVALAERLLSDAGLPLHPSNKVVTALRTGTNSAWHIGKLSDWLKKQDSDTAEAAPPVATLPTTDITAEQKQLLDGAVISELDADLRHRAVALHKEHAHVHALMTNAETDDQRAEHAMRIMTLIVPALDTLYDRLRALKAGQPDPHPDTAAPGKENLTRQLASKRSQLSALRRKLAKETDPAKIGKTQASIEKILTEIEALQAQGA